jgi:DNA-binding PadR family transcriptional regulator
MAGNSTNIDFNGLIDELKNFAKTKFSDLGARRPAAAPDDVQTANAILAALEAGDKNLQQLAQSISLTSGGAWNPSVGILQQAISNLTDDGNVSATTDGDRKVFSLTKKGRKALEAAKSEQATSEESGGTESTSSGSRSAWLNCEPQFLVNASKLGPAMLDIAQTGTREQQQKAAAVLEKTRNELHQILANHS